MKIGEYNWLFLLVLSCSLVFSTAQMQKEKTKGKGSKSKDKSKAQDDKNGGNVCKCCYSQPQNTCNDIYCEGDSKFECACVKEVTERPPDSGERECPIQPQSDEQTGVSVGLAVGLLFVGVVVGTILTAAVCICVPSLHSKISIFRGKVTGRFQKRRTMEARYETPKDLDKPVTDNTLPPGTTNISPTAPFSSASPGQTAYQGLDSVPKVRDSHTYTRLQPDSNESKEPMGEDNRGYSATDNANSAADNQPIRVTDTDDEAANHNYYNVLEAQNEADTSNLTEDGMPLSDHKYFVLEEQN